jgi:hypothetical protein
METKTCVENSHLLTSRFNNETSLENKDYRNKHPKLGCVYCCPEKISKDILPDETIYVLEMNNETNKIIGIGKSKNRTTNQRYNIYNNKNYNRFQYIGKHRIDRSEMDDYENNIMRVFDILCFQGLCHQKRGQGLRRFPQKMLKNCSPILDLTLFIEEMFKKRYG